MWKRIAGWYQFLNTSTPSNPASGAFLYGQGDKLRVREPAGTDYALGPPVEIDSVIFDGGDPTTDHTLGDTIIFDAGGVV